MGPIGINPLTGEPLLPVGETRPGAEPAVAEEEAQPSLLEQLLARANPVADAAQRAALRSPADREEEVYKRKIQQMFGVKLGEKNPKWKSALRFVGEGLGDLAAGYNRTPTLREQSRKQAAEEYKLENEVLGKESSNLLSRLVTAMGQEKRAATEANKLAAKKEYDTLMAGFKGRALDNQEKLTVAKIEQLALTGKHQEALAELRKMQATNEQKKGAFIGKTPEMIAAEAGRKDPQILQDIFNLSGARQAGKVAAGGGGGTTRTTNSVRSSIQPNPVTGEMEVVQLPSTSTSTSGGASPDRAREFMQSLPGATPPPATPPVVSPPAVSESPTPATAVPPSAPKPPRPRNTGAAFQATSRLTNRADMLHRSGLGIMTPDMGKRYTAAKEAATFSSELLDGIWQTALDFDSGGQSALDKYSGPGGFFRNFFGKKSGKAPTSVVVSDESLDAAMNKHRVLTTGAGAGFQELRWLNSRYPEIGKNAGTEHKYTNLQKALTLHFAGQKHLWNYAQGGDPLAFGKFFPAELVVKRIDDIVNDYKQLEKQMASSRTPQQRKDLVAAFQRKRDKMLDAQAMFNEAWSSANPDKAIVQRERIP